MPSLERRDAFWKKFPGLLWSNSKAADSVMIRAALMRPRFHELLAIAEEFGLERVTLEWNELQEDELSATRRKIVSSILNNLAIRFRHASGVDQSRVAGALR
jgi:hypothetical protein